MSDLATNADARITARISSADIYVDLTTSELKRRIDRFDSMVAVGELANGLASIDYRGAEYVDTATGAREKSSIAFTERHHEYVFTQIQYASPLILTISSGLPVVIFSMFRIWRQINTLRRDQALTSQFVEDQALKRDAIALLRRELQNVEVPNVVRKQYLERLMNEAADTFLRTADIELDPPA